MEHYDKNQHQQQGGRHKHRLCNEELMKEETDLCIYNRVIIRRRNVCGSFTGDNFKSRFVRIHCSLSLNSSRVVDFVLKLLTSADVDLWTGKSKLKINTPLCANIS